MNLIKINPFLRLHQQPQKSFEKLINCDLSRFRRPDHVNALPHTNVIEFNNGYELQIALPGFRKEDLKIAVVENELSVRCDVRREKGIDTSYIRKEFTNQTFVKSFALTKEIDQSNIVAEFKHGILHVSLPLKEIHTTRKVELM